MVDTHLNQALEQEVRAHVNARLGNLEGRTGSVETAVVTLGVECRDRFTQQDKILGELQKYVRHKAPGLYVTRKKVKILPILTIVVTVGVAAAYHWWVGDFFTWVWDVKG